MNLKVREIKSTFKIQYKGLEAEPAEQNNPGFKALHHH